MTYAGFAGRGIVLILLPQTLQQLDAAARSRINAARQTSPALHGTASVCV
jgi:hypothetical protein